MNSFGLAIFCAALVAISASGVAIVPATAHGGAIAGHGLGGAVVAGPAGIVTSHGALGLGLGGVGLGGLGLGHVGLGLGGVGLGGLGLGHVGLGLGHVGLGLGHGLVGSGIEGQYIPSGNELHYDDGSYRPEHHLAGHGILGHY